jgi:hypothetical protein
MHQSSERYRAVAATLARQVVPPERTRRTESQTFGLWITFAGACRLSLAGRTFVPNL